MAGELCGVRTVEIPSPGTPHNGVTLKSGVSANEGVNWLKNVGQCRIFIHCFDGGGKLLDEANPLELRPGGQEPRFIPPPGTRKIVAFSATDCDNYSALHYDPCTGIA